MAEIGCRRFPPYDNIIGFRLKPRGTNKIHRGFARMRESSTLLRPG